MSTIKVNTIENRNGSNINIGKSGTTVGFVAGTTVDFSTNSPTLTGVATVNGITEADQWVLTTNLSASGNNDITANLARVSLDGFSQIGTGMTQSSGVFTFPSTGMWYVNAHGDFLATGGNSGFSTVYIKVTTDNSTYNNRVISWNSHWSAYAYAQTDNMFLFNVTNTSTHKVLFAYEVNTATTIEGSANNIRTNFLFLRIGDSQ